MARPTRSSRRIPLKYSEDENVLPAKLKKTLNNAGNVAKLRSTSSSKETQKAVKGKLSAVKNVSGFDPSVLRDRTNLDKREIKADILMKKGGGDNISGKTKKKNPVVDKSNNEDARKKVSSVKKVKTKRPKDADKTEPRRSLRRSTDLRGSKQPVETKRKFFKNKAKPAENDVENISPEKKVTIKPVKQKKIVASKKSRLSRSFRLRQMTLQESFAKENAKKTLRPRRTVKNYREDTVLEKSSVKITDDTVDGKKLPVYKSVKTTDNGEDSGSEIYEFRYNSNDSQERIQKKKRKRRVATGVVAKKSKGKKLTNIKTTARTAFTRIEELPDEPDNRVPFNEQNDVDSSPVANVEEPPVVETLKPKAKPIVVESVDLKGEERVNLDITPQIINPKRTDRPRCRATSAFIVQPNVPYRAMLNHALLNKSISPITKAMDNFDPGSPWRAPSFTNQEFFRVKSVVQSTPQIPRISTIPKPTRTLSKIRSAVKDSQNLQPSPKKDEQAIIKDVAKTTALGKSPRKFGTEISNINSSSGDVKAIKDNTDKSGSKESVILAKSPRKFGNEISNVQPTNFGAKVLKENSDKYPRKFGTGISNVNASTIVTRAIIENTEETASKQSIIPAKSPRKFGNDVSNVNITPIDAEAIIEYSSPFDGNYGDDKENSAPNSSPSKTANSINSQRPAVGNSSPLRALNNLANDMNSENQAGPSGLQKHSPLQETRRLKQSNLNNFLNLENVPTSTRITTAHGIFDDPQSEPINGKSINKKKIDEPNVENAFGFDEEDLNESPAIFTSPIKSSNVPNRLARKRLVPKVENNKKECTSDDNAILFPRREIDKPLRPIIVKPKIISETKAVKEKKQDLPQSEKPIVTFSDTFDLSIDQNQTNDNEENLLFADLEPVHFKQPPRHLYKRKRNPTCITYSEDEDENGNAAALVNHPTKKRKISKLEKQQQKKLEEWAKDLNSTFEEIDHFNLIVE